MTEDEATAWLRARNVPCETLDRLQRYVDLLRREAGRQNLVSIPSLAQVWARHIVDSGQLLDLAPDGAWIDIGSGAGLPGLIVAMIGNRAVTLVEPRRGRVSFLRDAVEASGSGDMVQIIPSRVQSIAGGPSWAVISARAYAPLSRLIGSAYHLAEPGTCWLLPKGRSARSEIAAARMDWHGDFDLVRSVTDPAAWIVSASNIRRRR